MIRMPTVPCCAGGSRRKRKEEDAGPVSPRRGQSEMCKSIPTCGPASGADRARVTLARPSTARWSAASAAAILTVPRTQNLLASVANGLCSLDSFTVVDGAIRLSTRR